MKNSAPRQNRKNNINCICIRKCGMHSATSDTV